MKPKISHNTRVLLYKATLMESRLYTWSLRPETKTFATNGWPSSLPGFFLTKWASCLIDMPPGLDIFSYFAYF
jgi:hypothetical protein